MATVLASRVTPTASTYDKSLLTDSYLSHRLGQSSTWQHDMPIVFASALQPCSKTWSRHMPIVFSQAIHSAHALANPDKFDSRSQPPSTCDSSYDDLSLSSHTKHNEEEAQQDNASSLADTTVPKSVRETTSLQTLPIRHKHHDANDPSRLRHDGTTHSDSSLLHVQTTSCPSDAPQPDIAAENLTHHAPLDTLDYQISPDFLHVATQAPTGSPSSFWSHLLYRSSTGKPITIYLSQKAHTVPDIVKLFVNEPVLGFDMEWESGSRAGKDGIKRCISLIQIASEDKVALFQIAKFNGDTPAQLMPPSLRTLLESPAIIKAGVNISGDFTRLGKALGVHGRGLCDTSRLYHIVHSAGSPRAKPRKNLVRLADQVEEILSLPLDKGPVRTSRWSSDLSREQQNYAATDAYAGFRLWHALEARRLTLPGPPLSPPLFEVKHPHKIL